MNALLRAAAVGTWLLPAAGTFAAATPGAAPSPPSDAQAAEAPAQPPTPAPREVPPAPAQTPPPPPATARAAPASPAPQPTGQWVYTAQYGWVWMPYGDAYVHAPRDGGEPYMYVYYPSAGWSWVVAPWVWGWGPVPRFGVHGGWRFAWYGHDWGPRWVGFRPVPYRHGFAHRRWRY